MECGEFLGPWSLCAVLPCHRAPLATLEVCNEARMDIEIEARVCHVESGESTWKGDQNSENEPEASRKDVNKASEDAEDCREIASPHLQRDCKKRTALHMAVIAGDQQAVFRLANNRELLKARCYRRKTALHWAASLGRDTMVPLLLGCGLYSADENKYTALHLAVRGRHLQTVKELLKEMSEVNRRCVMRRTALHYAAIVGNLATVIVLLGSRARVNAVDREGSTPLILASLNGHSEVVRLLLLTGALPELRGRMRQTALHRAVVCGHCKVVLVLLEQGANMEAEDAKRRTPLHLAASRGLLDVSEALMSHGASVNAQCSEGCTPLHEAARKGHTEIVESLLRGGSDIRIKNKTGRIALHLAASSGNKKTIEVLLHVLSRIGEPGLVNARCQFRRIPLHDAISSRSLSAVKVLVSAGSKIFAKCAFRRIATDHAKFVGVADIYIYLKHQEYLARKRKIKKYEELIAVMLPKYNEMELMAHFTAICHTSKTGELPNDRVNDTGLHSEGTTSHALQHHNTSEQPATLCRPTCSTTPSNSKVETLQAVSSLDRRTSKQPAAGFPPACSAIAPLSEGKASRGASLLDHRTSKQFSLQPSCSRSRRLIEVQGAEGATLLHHGKSKKPATQLSPAHSPTQPRSKVDSVLQCLCCWPRLRKNRRGIGGTTRLH